MKIIDLNETNFESEISNDLIMVEFYTKDCDICQNISKEIQDIADEAAFKVGRVDVLENPKLEAKFEILSIPTVSFFKEGKLVYEMIGFSNKESLLKIGSVYK